jgi:hypothetical protein
MAKVAICIPSGDIVHADFAMSLAALAHGCGRFVQNDVVHEAVNIALINAKGSLIVNNRNLLVKQAQSLGVDYLFFVDSDMIFPQYTLRRLLSHDKDIVGCTYIQREEPHRLLGKAIDDRQLDEAVSGTNLPELMEVGALPGGCMLIKLSAFKEMAKPYYRTPAHQDAVDGNEWIEGEDYYFCRKAREKGLSIYVDWYLSSKLGHVGCRINSLPISETPIKEDSHVIIH